MIDVGIFWVLNGTKFYRENAFQAAPSAGPMVHEWYDTPLKYR